MIRISDRIHHVPYQRIPGSAQQRRSIPALAACRIGCRVTLSQTDRAGGATTHEIAPHIAQGRMVAQQQHALFGELRVALAGVHIAAELAFTERDAALDALRPVVACFPTHLDAPDLTAARALLGA